MTTRLAAEDVIDPETRACVVQRLRVMKIALDHSRDFPIHALGSGSDHSAFLEHLGIASLIIGYGEAGASRAIYCPWTARCNISKRVPKPMMPRRSHCRRFERRYI